MSQAFRAAAAGQAVSSPLTVTVPATVQAGDTVLIFVSVDTQPSTLTATSTTGTTLPSQASVDASSAVAFSLFQFTAAAGDASATLTFNASASTTPIVAVLLSYSGAGLPQAGDIQSWSHAAATTATSASLTPGTAGSWGISCAGNNSGSPPTYSPGTFRANDSFDVTAAYDSNGTASPVGGGTWTNGASDVWWGYTIALPPPASPAPARPVIAPSLAAIQAACW
jgi:hypothetical protein